MHTSDALQQIFDLLHSHYGPLDWWPGDSPFEIMVGAILTQNTNWRNVEKAIDNLQAADLLSLEKMNQQPSESLAEIIRPAGYFTVKAARLLNLCRMLKERWHCDLENFLQQSKDTLREELLMVKGIGPETADSIILYAAEQPVFVVDTYTHRILSRHDIIPEEYDYSEIQETFTDNLEESVSLFNEYHALLVQVGKDFCKKSKPDCESCPLRVLLPAT